MKFNKLKTRRGKLEEKIRLELDKPSPSLEVILSHVDTYEKDNLDTIEQLKRVKKIELNKINGAIRQFLNSHPILTKQLIGSLSKRIYGSLLGDKKIKNKNGFIQKIINKFKFKFTK